MRTNDLDYELPSELIARYPAKRRDGSRLMVVGEESDADHRFAELPGLVEEGALLVVNDTRVVPARLFGAKPSGGRFELLLIRKLDGDGNRARWNAMVRMAKRVRLGTKARVADAIDVEVLEGPDEEGTFVVQLTGEALDAVIAERGHMPLPPYIGRDAEPEDRDRYQTIFASEPGAVAAPTAGLHFTPEVLAGLEAAGVGLARITLHVGPGTFKPVTADDLDEHPMHSERYAIDEETAARVAETKERGAPVIAVGTTVVRALESAAGEDGRIVPGTAETRLLIQPGYRFRAIDGLITNFHLPRSTLLALVYALAGADRVRRAYAAAVARRYRFYSYGDAMFIPRSYAS